MLAAATGVAAACAESASASAVDISDGTAATQAGAADPIAVSSTAMPPSSKLQDVDHQALRDTLLLYDGVAMLVSLLTGKPAPTGAASHSTRKEAGKSDAAAALRAEAAQCSQYLSAILDACAHATSPPTLRQLLSHPYFAPVEGFEQEDVRAAYRRWRKKAVPSTRSMPRSFPAPPLAKHLSMGRRSSDRDTTAVVRLRVSGD